MESVSVGKKTGNQKALKDDQLRRKRGKYNWVSNVGFSSIYDDDDANDDVDDDKEEEECLVIDESEFFESNSTRRSENNLVEEVVIQKYYNFGEFNNYHPENSLGFNDKGKRVMNYYPNNAVCIISDDDDDANDGVHVSDDVNNGVHNNDDVVNDNVNDGVHLIDDNVVANDSVNDDVHINDDSLKDCVYVNDVNDDVHVNDVNVGVHVNDGVHKKDDDGDVNDNVNDFHINVDSLNDGVHVNDGVLINGVNENDGVHIDDDDVNDVNMIVAAADDDMDYDNDNDDGDDDDDDGDDGDGKRIEEPNVEFQMRLFEGMILLANPIKTNANGNGFVGSRTRSHFEPKSSSKKKKIKDGTFSVPITIDIDESSSSTHIEEIEHNPESHPKYCEDNNVVIKRKRGRPPKKKENKVDELEPPKKKENKVDELQPPKKKKSKVDELEPVIVFKGRKGSKKRLKTNEAHNILLNAMLENDASVNEASLASLVSSASEPSLPLKFRFGVVKPQEAKISEEEEESESLFNEMDFALGVCEIGLQTSCSNNDEEDEIAVPLASAILHEKLCREGKHYWIQDDEIGIKCKFCSVVKLEIRDVMPEFNDNPFGKSKEENRYYGQFPYDGTNSVSEKFQFPNIICGSRGDSTSSDTTQGTVWDLIPGTKKELYPHQRDGFEFLWKNIAGGIRVNELGNLTKSGTGGCIICHAPGTGKTRLAIVFLQSFMKKYPKSKPVILAPYSMLRTWEEEFARWKVDIPFFNLNEKELSGNEDRQFLEDSNGKNRTAKNGKEARMMKLATWIKGKGVLAVSYGLFQRLAYKKAGVIEKVKEKGTDEMIRRVLLEQPDILVLDEGHTARNDNSHIWKVLTEVSTKRRVILSGTPFQNSFEELHTTISVVREEFAVPFYCQLNDSKRRIEVLRKQFEPFVHVHKGEILKETLPGLFHSLIVLRPSDLQKMYFAHLARWRSNFIKFDNLTSITSVHPSIFCNTKSDFLADKEQALLEQHKMDVDAGVKAKFLLELIKLCKGERILVFGQYIPPLEFIGYLLESLFYWTEGRELLKIYGNQDMKTRQSSIKLFNDPGSKARVLLASTKACCEGISLVGASRVVLLDVVWNPSVERQAISRAYRIGQQKDVFVYHLITSGTIEEEKYRRQTAKERFGELLFSSSSPSLDGGITHKTSTESRVVSNDRILEEMTNHDKTKNMFKKIVCQPKADDLIKRFGSHDL